ncbi:NAD(P)-dependent oxidoreductase [Variovorax dokdonensis]|uniref:NAD(P)-dependent oxidoreductase n=1 Tax=Variovorax dokdonensis TaxID=344883 RepID=A0ABT7NCI6_9BURK|nr:NAD(P)-dependent oxidoreductase [Variovorax dokdonensis]MDM0045659.1 NAD(P)-dependent oxidoreductase [Variovorax dokdonensis]
MADRPAPNARRVAIVGVGMIGTAVAQRLLDCGHVVRLHTRSPEKLAPLVARGATAATSAAEAALGCEFVITALNSADIVRQAVLGPHGAAESMDAQSVLIDMSSIDPPSTRRLADDLKGRCGAAWVDAPLSGGAPKALVGKLTVMAGGSAEDVAHAGELMRDLCANYTHMGPTGAGQTTKLVNQVLCALNNQAVAEAVRLAEAGGVDARLLPKALAGGRADSAALQEFAPQMAARETPPTGAIRNMLKDMEGVQALAHANRLPLPLSSAVAELLRTFVAAGMGDEQIAAIMRQFEGFRPAQH